MILALATVVDAAPAFGPKEYVVKPALPLPAIERFPACQPDKGGQLRVENGPNGRARVTLAVLVLNQRETVVMLEGPGQRRVVERAVQLAASNTLLVWMIGPPGATARRLGHQRRGVPGRRHHAARPRGLRAGRDSSRFGEPWTGPPGLGVAVNGVPAAVHSGAFVVELPVTAGPTELAAIATAPDGSMAEARQPVSVVEAPEPTVPPARQSSRRRVAPDVGFSLSSLVGITDVKLDLQGDGPVEFEGPSLDGQVFTYGQPGVYVATVQATDVDGQVHTATTVVEVYDRSALDVRLRAVWGGFKDAVRGGDVTRAVSLLHSETRDAYADQLGLLRPQTLARHRYVPDGNSARGDRSEGRRIRDAARPRRRSTLSFAVWFRVDQDGIWRLFRF